MADKSSKIALIYLEYAVFMAIAGILRILPIFVAVRLGKLIAWAFCLASRRSGKFIEYQMRECFGARFTDEEYHKLVDKFYTHFGCFLAESVRMKVLNKCNIDDFVEWGGFYKEVEDIIAKSGTGVFFVTGHIGNWEFTGAAGAVKGLLAGSIARPLDNQLINKKVTEYREQSGQEIWDKDGAVLKLLRAIKKKQSVGVLVDQDAGEQGLSVPFLGRPASTNVAIAEMSIRLGAPIIPTALVRVDGRPMKFKLVMGDVVIPSTNKKEPNEVYRVMEAVNAELSKIISSYPEQWLWIHKRWKTPNPTDRKRFRRYE